MSAASYRGRRGLARVSAKDQITLPADALADAGLKPGDTLEVHAYGRGRIVLIRRRDTLAEYAGKLTGIYRPGEVDESRDNWP